jgi:tryptophan synthase beta chain
MISSHPYPVTEPDESGYFGEFGGRFVPETLIPALAELQQAYAEVLEDRDFQDDLARDLQAFVGRPTPLTYAARLSEHYGVYIYLKREDLCHTGAHKINNAVGQVLLARRMGKRNIVAETGAGQHGVATATACAKYGLNCIVYMGEEDVHRQRLNVERMRLLGAEVRPVTSGTRTLKDATSEAIRHWVTNVRDCFYVIGSVVGPHPYPMMVRNFHRIIGLETRGQILQAEGRLPDRLVACVGGGSNAAGFFHPFLDEPGVRMTGVEAAGLGVTSGKTAATLTKGKPGVLHGSLSYLLQTPAGQVDIAHSISAGLDYPGIGPEHSHWFATGRVDYASATDDEALQAVERLSRMEGIIPALETAHAFAWLEMGLDRDRDRLVVFNCSGRGDKDMGTIMDARSREGGPTHG